MDDTNHASILTELVVRKLGELQMEALQRKAESIVLSKALDNTQESEKDDGPEKNN